MSYRFAPCLLTLRAEVDARWPGRLKVSDGMLGDARHQSEGSASDHNPWLLDAHGVGVVRAIDITAASIGGAWLAEHLRQMGLLGDRRLVNHGYVIFDRKIASEVNDWVWRPYDGPNPHHTHVHLSVTRTEAGYDSTAGWGVKPAPPHPHPHPSGGGVHHPLAFPVLRLGVHNNRWAALVQRFLGIRDDGDFGPRTDLAVRRYQRMRGLGVDGIVGPLTWAPIRHALKL